MEPRDRQILHKIHAESEIIAQLLLGIDYAGFVTDEKTKRAVSMTLINIGELVKGLSEEFRTENSHIPWRAISGLRDVTAHRYQTLLPQDIWTTVQNDVPKLKEQIADML